MTITRFTIRFWLIWDRVTGWLPLVQRVRNLEAVNDDLRAEQASLRTHIMASLTRMEAKLDREAGEPHLRVVPDENP